MALSRSMSRLLLILTLTLLPALSLARPAYAAELPGQNLQGSTPPPPGSSGGGGGTDFAGKPLVDVLYQLALLVVQLVVFGAGAIMAANIARGAFSAQIANLVGSPMGMSQAWMNIIAAVITFVIAVLSPMLIGIIAEAVRAFVNVSFTLPRF